MAAMLERDGVMLHYELHGGPHGRPPVLLTHGFGASGGMWEANLPALTRQRQAITWDLRGHGASDAPGDGALYSHELCLQDMAALLDLAGAERAVLCGMSLGGFLSLSFRLRFPERVTGLVLVDTGPGFRDGRARERWNDWARQRADELDAGGVAALPQGVEQAQADHVHGAAGIAHAARGMLAQRDAAVFESLGSIGVPTLIVVGSEDQPFLAAADVMEARIPGARKLVLPRAGHAANMDAPEDFGAAVTEFLEEL